MKTLFKPSYNQQILFPFKNGITLYLKREDEIHPHVSGNKFRKLKYNIVAAKNKKHHTILTFGGAFSNHICATASAGKLTNLNTIGIIRGDELKQHAKNNPTLNYAQSCGMRLKYISRAEYKNKNSPNFIDALKHEFGDFYLLPEGGTNALAIKGCEEILTPNDNVFDVICASVGTGGTLSGLINCSKPSQQVLGFPALKGDFLQEDICKFVTKSNWSLISEYHFGGYAKVPAHLIAFINAFKTKHNVALDPVYTGKMLYGIFDLILKGYFKKNTKILAIHTGGLQGVAGMNMRLKKQNKPLIHIN